MSDLPGGKRLCFLFTRTMAPFSNTITTSPQKFWVLEEATILDNHSSTLRGLSGEGGVLLGFAIFELDFGDGQDVEIGEEVLCELSGQFHFELFPHGSSKSNGDADEKTLRNPLSKLFMG